MEVRTVLVALLSRFSFELDPSMGGPQQVRRMGMREAPVAGRQQQPATSSSSSSRHPHSRSGV